MTFPAWRNVKYHGRGRKFSATDSGLFRSQNCNFPEECFILISFCYSVPEYTGRVIERYEELLHFYVTGPAEGGGEAEDKYEEGAISTHSCVVRRLGKVRFVV
jgi:hypothetical protein